MLEPKPLGPLLLHSAVPHTMWQGTQHKGPVPPAEQQEWRERGEPHHNAIEVEGGVMGRMANSPSCGREKILGPTC